MRSCSTPAPQDDVAIPFVAQLSTTAYDWVGKTDAVTQEQIVGVLAASGFDGRVVSYDAASHTLLIENNGVLQAAVATALNVQITCTPIPVRVMPLCHSSFHIPSTGPRGKLPPGGAACAGAPGRRPACKDAHGKKHAQTGPCRQHEGCCAWRRRDLHGDALNRITFAFHCGQ